MRLVKDTNPGAYAVQVRCIGPHHHELNTRAHSRMFTLAEGYADLDGKAFEAYYCDACAGAEEGR